MARSLNQCSFIGNLGNDVDTRFMPSGQAVSSFSLAVEDRYKDKQTGEQVDQTEWVRCVAFGKLAEICSRYLLKGSKVYVQGRMKTRKWDKDGVTHYKTEVVADQLQLLGGSADRQESRQEEPQPEPMAFDDDIPF